MTFQYDPTYKGHTIAIVDTIYPGRGFKARFSIHRGDAIATVTTNIPLVKEGVIDDEVFSTPDEAKIRAFERARAWIDSQPES
jgi:hypothetical protein